MDRTNTKTFRLGDVTINSLEQIAKKEGITVNQLVSNVLDEFVNWDYDAKSIGFIGFPKSLLINLYDSLSEESIRKLAKIHAEHNIADIVTYIEKKFTQDTFLAGIEKWAKTNRIPIQKTEKSDPTYIINLGMGKKFGMFFAQFIEYVLEQFGVSRMEYNVNEHTLNFTLISKV